MKVINRHLHLRLPPSTTTTSKAPTLLLYQASSSSCDSSSSDCSSVPCCYRVPDWCQRTTPNHRRRRRARRRSSTEADNRYCHASVHQRAAISDTRGEEDSCCKATASTAISTTTNINTTSKSISTRVQSDNRVTVHCSSNFCFRIPRASLIISSNDGIHHGLCLFQSSR